MLKYAAGGSCLTMKPSRAMIPAEIAVALYTLAYAWSGGIAWPLEPGPLYRFIGRVEGLIGNIVWALVLGAPALILIVVAVREWMCWKRCSWTQLDLYGSTKFRGKLVCTLGVSWLYVIHISVVADKVVPTILAHAVVSVLVCTWSYWENRRVRREIRCATAGLPAHAG